jgi:hypothetical protein
VPCCPEGRVASPRSLLKLGVIAAAALPVSPRLPPAQCCRHQHCAGVDTERLGQYLCCFPRRLRTGLTLGAGNACSMLRTLAAGGSASASNLQCCPSTRTNHEAPHVHCADSLGTALWLQPAHGTASSGWRRWAMAWRLATGTPASEQGLEGSNPKPEPSDGIRQLAPRHLSGVQSRSNLSTSGAAAFTVLRHVLH